MCRCVDVFVCVLLCVLMCVLFVCDVCRGGARGGARGGGGATVSFFIRCWSVSNSSIHQNSGIFCSDLQTLFLLQTSSFSNVPNTQRQQQAQFIDFFFFLSTEENIKKLDSHNRKKQFSLSSPSSSSCPHPAHINGNTATSRRHHSSVI